MCVQHAVDAELSEEGSLQSVPYRAALSRGRGRTLYHCESVSQCLLTECLLQPGAYFVLYDLILSAAHKMAIVNTPVLQMRRLRPEVTLLAIANPRRV